MVNESTPALAAVVVGWNHRSDSAECLESIVETAYPALQVWYVDNGSTDGAVELIRQRFAQVRVLALEQNRGLVGGYNAGIEAALEAGADYLCLFNNDVAVALDFFEALAAVAAGNANAGLLAPKIVLYSDENILWSAGARERAFPPGIVQRGTGRPARQERFNRVEPVAYATSCAWMMSAQMVRQVGLFDPSFSFYYSDYAYCEQVQRHGWQILYVPGSVVKHKVSLSTQRGGNAAHWWHNLGVAERRFYREYRGRTLFLLHAGWILMRTVLQGRGRFIPAYLKGLLDGS